MKIFDNEIDRIIAEKIMGWKKDDEAIQRWVTPSGLLHESYWRPTYDISDAWKVVEKLSEKLTVQVSNHTGGCTVRIFNSGMPPSLRDYYNHYEEDKRNTPYAICKCVLEVAEKEY